MQNFFPAFISFFFALKARLQVLKFEYCQIKLENTVTKDKLASTVTGKISLKLDFNSNSTLLLVGRQFESLSNV